MLKLFDTNMAHILMIRLKYYDHPGSQDKVSLLISTKMYDNYASSSVYTSIRMCIMAALYSYEAALPHFF